MKFFIQIDKDEPFKPGDISIKDAEVCMFTDGDRTAFRPIINMFTLREITKGEETRVFSSNIKKQLEKIIKQL